MTVKRDMVEDICALADRQVQDLYPHLQLLFIPHESGQFSEIVETNEYSVSEHPATDVARSILEKNTSRELSSFLGMAINQKVKWLGLTSSEYILGLFNININEFESAKEARRTIYHLAWHAIDLYEIRQKPEYMTKFRTGPMIPKRSPMNLARLNLQADIFAAVMGGLMGDEKSLSSLACQRAKDSISAVYSRRAEDYPFVIAAETAKYAYSELLSMKPPPTKYMHFARQIALEVSQTFDETNIRQWWGFSEPAQDMAWRNFNNQTILSCAIYTSEDPFVRATAHLVSDLSGTEIMSNTEIERAYNSFANHEQNQLLHRELMEKTFEDAIARGLAMESGQPLLIAANEQNENLADGRIIGWCASALQAAARAFENALSNGAPPLQAAKIEFESTKEETGWESLKKIGESVIEQKRKGFTVTLGSLADLCGGQPAFAMVATSIQSTLANPAYANNLKVANDFSPRAATPTAAPSSPAPKMDVSLQAIPAGPSGPSLGGSGNNAARQRAILEKMRIDKEHQSKGDEERSS